MTSYKRGDVVFVPFPFTDLSAVKQRPALVVSSDNFNTAHDDLTVAAITSQIPARLAPEEFLIPQSELAGGGLPKASLVKTSKLVTLHQRLIIRRIGALPSATLEQVLQRIREQF